MMGAMRVGIADHLGWAVAVTAGADHEVVDRRRIELVEPGLSAAPIHYDRGRLDDAAAAALVATVRASVVRTAGAALDDLAGALPAPIVSLSLRAWPADFPVDIAVVRRPPYESRVDAIMYRQVLAGLAHERGWDVHIYVAKDVAGQAAAVLGDRAGDVLDGPKARLGPPWTKDHRTALAAAVVAGAGTVTIRDAEAADLPALQRVYRTASLSNAGDRAVLLAHPETLVLADTAVREGRTRVATAGGEVIGFATLDEAASGLELEDLFVDPDRMRRGVGRALVRDAARIARARGVARIVVTGNPHAREFYEDAGFVADGETATTFGPGLLMHLDVGP